MNEQLQAYAVELVEAIKGIAPDALDMALRITRISAAGDVLAAVAALALIAAFIRPAKWARRQVEQDVIALGPTFVLVIGGIFCLAAGTVAVLTLFNIWTWVGLFSPELRLAKDALRALLAGGS